MDQTVSTVPPIQPVQPRRTGLIIGIIAAVIIIALLGVIIFLLIQGNQEDEQIVDQGLFEMNAPQTQAPPTGAGTSQGSQNQTPRANTPAPSASKPAPASGTSTPAPTTGPSVADFAGQWNGSYSSNPLAGKTCAASGATSFSISQNGSVTGYATVNGVKIPGLGSIDKNGNIKGTWNYTGASLSYSGKLNSGANTGSGTYKNDFGCFGSFSITR